MHPSSNHLCHMNVQPPDKATAFNAIPIINPKVEILQTPSKLIRIRYPIQLNRYFLKLLPAKFSPPLRTLELDEMGSFVWSHIDGQTSVKILAERIEQNYSCQHLDAERAVALFLRRLGQRGIIGLR